MKFYFEPRTSVAPASLRVGTTDQVLYITLTSDEGQQLVDWLNTMIGIEHDALVEALEEIAAGACCQTPGGSLDDPCCDTMVARAALAKAHGEEAA